MNAHCGFNGRLCFVTHILNFYDFIILIMPVMMLSVNMNMYVLLTVCLEKQEIRHSEEVLEVYS